MRRLIESALFAIAVLCLSWYGWRSWDIHEKQSRAAAGVKHALSSVAAVPAGDVVISSEMPADGIIGELDIPSVHLSAPVTTGDGEDVLDFSVGYLPDTPLPWMPGNSALAAHRDRLFRRLEHVQKGDAINLSTPHGDLKYRVVQTLIVNPADVWVLKPILGVDLTLITCYPFSFVGNAPHRFIVQAEKIH